MSIQTELTRIANAKAAIKAAVERKGVTVPDGIRLDSMAGFIESIEAGSGQAFQCGTIVSADGTNLVVPCALDNILIVRKYINSNEYTAYLLNTTLLVAGGVEIQIATDSGGRLTNQGIGTFSITKEFGQTTFTQTKVIKFVGEYCYIAWDNA